MKKSLTFVRGVWRATPLSLWAATAACVVFLAAVPVSISLTGCASTPQGLTREQAIYQTATNVVADINKVVPYLPVPVSSTAEIALAIAGAALAAWNTHQQVAISKLKNGNAKPASPPPPAVAAPPAPQPT